MDIVTLAMAKKYVDQYISKKKTVLASIPLEEGIGQIGGRIGLVAGETYTITTDSGTFTSVCEGGDGVFFVGNLAVLEPNPEIDTGESYLVIEVPPDIEGGTDSTMATDANRGTRIAVSQISREINGNCLPKGGAGYTTEKLIASGELPAQSPYQDQAYTGEALVAGKTYTLYLDGVAHTAVAVIDAAGRVSIGDMPTDGYAAVYTEVETDGTLYRMLQVGFTDPAKTFSITERTIHPIDPKYLPGVCLPVVELSTVLTANASLTAEENAKLKAAWEGFTPVVIRCGVSTADHDLPKTAAVWTPASNEYAVIFAFYLGTSQLTLMSTDNGETWVCVVG